MTTLTWSSEYEVFRYNFESTSRNEMQQVTVAIWIHRPNSVEILFTVEGTLTLWKSELCSVERKGNDQVWRLV